MRIITFGEIMLRLKSPGQERLFQSPLFEASFGGSEANVAVALARFGLDAAFVTLLPDNQIGKECARTLRYHGVDTSSLRYKKGRLGIYFFENGAAQRPSNVIYDREGAVITLIDEKDLNWKNIFSGASWFHVSGITPALSKQAADATLLAVQEARNAGLTVSFDLNFRAKLWNYGEPAQKRMRQLAEYADILIGNEEDYQKSLGIAGPQGADSGIIDSEAYLLMCRQALQEFPHCRYAAVTLRESFSADHNAWSALLVSREGFWKSRRYDIADIVDRVGAGDSFSASLICGLIERANDPQQALEFATAASCLKHSIPGDFAVLEKTEVEKLMAGNASGRVQR